MPDLSPIHSVCTPVRSISLPSRPHLVSYKIESELTKLRTWQSPTSNPLAAETIQLGLTSLAELFNCVEELIQFPQTQQAFRHQHVSQVEEALDGSVVLLDICSTARDLFLSTKEHVQELQSALRRKGRDLSSVESSINAYITFRKKARKAMSKSLRALKKVERNSNDVGPDGSLHLSEMDQHLSFVIRVTRETNEIAVSIFKSLVLFLFVPATKTNAGGWSLILKLIRSGLISSDHKAHKIFNEVESVDVALSSMNGQIKKSDSKLEAVQGVQRRLEALDVSIKRFETKLDCMYRCVIQNRVSLLNLVTP